MKELLRILFSVSTLLIIFLRNVHSVLYPWDDSYYTAVTVCTSKSCYDQTQFIKENMDTTVDPCDDFYQYACGNWLSIHPPPQYYPQWSVDYDMGEEAFFHTRQILEEEVKAKDSVELRKAKKFFKACMELPYLGLHDGSMLSSFINAVGYFPLIYSPSRWHNMPWIDVHNYYIGLTGESALFDLYVQTDPLKDLEPTLHVAEVPSAFGLFVPRDVFTVSQLRIYEKFLIAAIKHILPHVKSLPPYAILSKGLNEVLGFRRELHACKTIGFKPSKPLYTGSVAEFNKFYTTLTKNYKSSNRIPWTNVIKLLYKNKKSTREIERMPINLDTVNYFRTLGRLLDKTPQHVLVNHFHLYFIERHLLLTPTLRKMMMDVITEKGKLIGIVRYLGKRWHLCIARNELIESLGIRYVTQYFDNGNKAKAHNLVNELKDMIKIQIADSKWLDHTTARKTTQLINDMKTTLGYPEYYDDFSKRADYLISKCVDPACLDAKYSPMSNRISISAAYLNLPMYSVALPHACTYGSMGSFIGHQIYHSLGSANIKRQEPEYLWSSNMLKLHEKKLQCFVNQFDQVPVKELESMTPVPKIDGLRTVDGNMADTMGLKLAYETFRKKVWSNKRCNLLPTLPGIDCYRLFFISYATTRCSSMTQDRIMEYVEFEDHSTTRLRVNGAVSNLPEFSKVFKCSKTSRMNPPNKCYLW